MLINKSLIIKPEFLKLYFSGVKTWEMRSSKTCVRETVGFIESGSKSIVGYATLISCSSHPVSKLSCFKQFHALDDLSLLDRWPFAWMFEDIHKLIKPIPIFQPAGCVIWVNHYPGIDIDKYNVYSNPSDHV